VKPSIARGHRVVRHPPFQESFWGIRAKAEVTESRKVPGSAPATAVGGQSGKAKLIVWHVVVQGADDPVTIGIRPRETLGRIDWSFTESA